MSLVATADAGRRAWLRFAFRVPGAKSVYLLPSRRIALAQGTAVVTSLVVAAVAPALSLGLGAALFGVPHVLSGVRHLAMKRSLARASELAVFAAVLFGAVAFVDGRPLWLGAVTCAFAAAVAAELLEAPVHAGLKGVLLTTVVAAAALALRFQVLFLVAVTHLHALGSVAFFCVAARRRGIVAWPVAVGAFAAVALVLLGAVDALIPSEAWLGVRGPDELLRVLSEPLAQWSSRWVGRSLVLYAFGQALHYAVWLRLMPEVDRPARVPWRFAQALAHLRQDFGAFTVPALALCAIAAVGMLLAGPPARELYFAVVYFHIGLEAAALTRAVLR